MQSTDQALFFFLETDERGQRKNQCKEISDTQNASSRSVMSGGTPSTPDKSHRGVVREPANARQQDTDSMRIHRRLQARKAERCNTGVASLDLAQARFSTKLHDSTLQRPPVSIATTTNLHLWPSTSSEYFLSLSRRAALATAPSTTAAFGQALPLAVTALFFELTAARPSHNRDSTGQLPAVERIPTIATSTCCCDAIATICQCLEW